MSIRTRIVRVAAALTLSATAAGIVSISPASATTPGGQTSIAAAGDPDEAAELYAVAADAATLQGAHALARRARDLARAVEAGAGGRPRAG